MPVSTFETITQANGNGGGTSSFNVTLPAGVKWTARVTDMQTWLTSTATGTGTGSAQAVAYTTTANSTGASRTAYVHVSAWSFGGMEKKADGFELFGIPVGEAIDMVMGRTRCTWNIDSSGVAHIYAIDNFSGAQAIVVRDATGTQHAPSGVDDWEVEELIVEESTDDAVGQVDVVGGRVEREVLLGQSDFTQLGWYGISIDPSWVNGRCLSFPRNGYYPVWSNYDVQQYFSLTSWFKKYLYRYDLNRNIFAAHLIGPDLQANEQPYSMLSQLLIARDKYGNYVNPDQENAIEGVSPLELLKAQYPDGGTIDYDRGYLLMWGGESYYIYGWEVVQPPIYGKSNPGQFTVAFKCAYRAYQTVSHTVPGAASQIRRMILRDDIIHKTREATKVTMPVNGIYDFNNHLTTFTEGIPLPAGASKNYSATVGTIIPTDLTISLPAGVVVDGMGELKQIADTIDPYVGIVSVNGRAAFSTWRDIAIGTNITTTNANYGLTGKEIVIAVSYSDDECKTEIAFTNRLGNDVNQLAQAFVDARSYRRAL